MEAKTLALYLGCDALYHMADEPEPYQTKIDWEVLRNVEQNPEETFVQPFLRKLSSMTLEEGAWCLKETFFDNVNYPLDEFKLELVGDGGNPRISIDNDHFTNSLTFGNKRGSIWSTETNAANVKIQSKIFSYLLSRGFDLFGLIEKGEAIDSSTLNPKKLMEAINIKYDTPIEVSQKEYDALMNMFGQIIAGRKDENGKYWIKLWVMRYKKHLSKCIQKLRTNGN